MSIRKTLAVLGAATLVSLSVAAGGGGRQNERAIDLLKRSMKGDFSVNVIAILLQRDPGGGDSFQRIKVVRSKAGKQRYTVLQPLRLQGVEVVDDGSRKRTYLPDQRVILDEASPAIGNSDLAKRMDLARRNYTFEIVSHPRVAGRTTLCISATPRNAELDVRRYYLDETTAYPLRMDTLGEDGDVTVVFETKDVQYPASLDANAFRLNTLSNAGTIKYSRPQNLNKAQAKSMVGFVPLVPNSLPLGFKVQEMQYNGSKDWKSVVVRLSDGLARATVYQWKPEGQPVKVMGDSTMLDHNGIRLMIVSELGPKLRAKLLQAFIAQAMNDDARAVRLYGMFSPEPSLQVIKELATLAAAFTVLEAPPALFQGAASGVPAYLALQ